MTASSATSAGKPERDQHPRSGLLVISRRAGAAVSFGTLALALIIAFRIEAGGPVRHLQELIFGQLAWITATLSVAWALVMFREIVGAYRKIAGFPWLASLSFAASAFSCVIALHACLP